MSEKRYLKFASDEADATGRGDADTSVPRRFLREAWEILRDTGISQRFLLSLGCGTGVAGLALILGEWRAALALLIFLTGGLFVSLMSASIGRRLRIWNVFRLFR